MKTYIPLFHNCPFLDEVLQSNEGSSLRKAVDKLSRTDLFLQISMPARFLDIYPGRRYLSSGSAGSLTFIDFEYLVKLNH